MARGSKVKKWKGPCVKKRWPTKIEAEMVLLRIQDKPRQAKKQPERVYQCPNCKGWHLTSMNVERDRRAHRRAS